MLRVRVGVVIIKDGKILLVRHQKENRTYWLLPGGGVDEGETLEECAKRELTEETGLQIELGKPIFISDTIYPKNDKHVINLFFLAHITGGTLSLGLDPVLAQVSFVDITQLPSLELHPPIGQDILRGYLENFQSDCRYLGKLWVN